MQCVNIKILEKNFGKNFSKNRTPLLYGDYMGDINKLTVGFVILK